MGKILTPEEKAARAAAKEAEKAAKAAAKNTGDATLVSEGYDPRNGHVQLHKAASGFTVTNHRTGSVSTHEENEAAQAEYAAQLENSNGH